MKKTTLILSLVIWLSFVLNVQAQICATPDFSTLNLNNNKNENNRLKL